MGTAGVERFDLGAAASDLAHVIEYGRRRPKHFSNVRRAPTGERGPVATRIRLAQAFGILEKRDGNGDDAHRLRGLGLHPRFANSAPASNDVTAIIPKVISLSTGQ